MATKKTTTRSKSTKAAAKPAAGAKTVNAPMPGTILKMSVKVGDTVKNGDLVCILEAMKMENNIDADRAGVVKQILVQQGATVMEGDVLIVIG